MYLPAHVLGLSELIGYPFLGILRKLTTSESIKLIQRPLGSRPGFDTQMSSQESSCLDAHCIRGERRFVTSLLPKTGYSTSLLQIGMVDGHEQVFVVLLVDGVINGKARSSLGFGRCNIVCAVARTACSRAVV